MHIHFIMYSVLFMMKHIIVDYDKFSGLWLSCDVGEAEIITILRKVLSCFTNIMVNDYATGHSDTISDAKIAKKSMYICLM